jgi:WD40 repeat protein
VLAVSVSEDGATIVAGFGDGKINVYGRQSNTSIWGYNTGIGVLSIGVSANGSTIVAGGSDGKIHVFGRQSNATIWNYNTGAIVLSVGVSADGSTIVAGGNDGRIRVFGRQSNATIWTYNTANVVESVAVSADGNTIVGGGDDYGIHVFGRQSNKTIWNFITPGFYLVRSVSVSADGDTIAAGAQDGYLRVFGRNTNTTLWYYKTTGIVWGVTVSRDGTTVAAGGSDGFLKVFAHASNATLLNFNTGGFITNVVAMSSDGSTISCGNQMLVGSRASLFSKTLGLLWDYSLPNAVASAYGPNAAISGDGTLIAFGGSDGKLYVFQYDWVAPVLGTPSIAPPSPVGGQSVTISVSATDNLAVSAVTLYYWNAAAGSWSSVAMTLAGAVYKATVGPFSSGDNVGYYISATDTSGNIASSPADAPLSYHTFTVASSSPGAPVSESMINVLIGVGLGAVIVMVASLVMTRGKKSRK